MTHRDRILISPEETARSEAFVSVKFFEERKIERERRNGRDEGGERERAREGESDRERERGRERESHIPSGSRMLIETLRNGVRRTAKSRLRRELVV